MQQSPKIQTTLTPTTLQIHLNHPQTTQSYHLTFTQTTLQKQLSTWFDSLQQLADHLKNPMNYRLDFQRRKLEVMSRHPTKVQMFMKIVQVEIQEGDGQGDGVEGIDQEGREIVRKCRREDELSDSDVKGMMLYFMTKINDLNLKSQTQSPQSSKISSTSYHSQIHHAQPSQSELNPLQKLQNQLKQKDEIIEVIIRKMKSHSDEVEQRMLKMQDRIQALEKAGKVLEKREMEMDRERDRERDRDRERERQRVRQRELVRAFVVDENCCSFDRLLLNEDQVIKIRGKQADVFSKINLRQSPTFSLRIHTLTSPICLGIVDSKLKSRPSFVNEPNCFVYYSNGDFYDGQNLKDKIYRKFNKGDVVTVTVDFVQQKIMWKVGDELRVSFGCRRLGEEGVDWVGYVWLLANGDGFSVLN